ncbi:MAG TPA: serine/threonine-protein kinase [Planctomycetota bacterium]|nr:serine/threonine-protein kinase [Planctomycetota bacterium]
MTDPSLEDIQDGILDRLHAGEPVDRAQLVAAHPAHAQALTLFFDVLDEIEAPHRGDQAGPSRLGEFEIVREIGRGGMGIVYEAQQISLKRRVALKVLSPELRRDERLVTRFRREAEAAARLRHPNVVPVYSVGESAGVPFFAMELVAGRSLRDVIRLRREGHDAGLPAVGDAWLGWAVQTVAQVADALDYVHGRGILHRDIKPGNIMLERDGTPRLTDFGLALDLQASEQTLTLAGDAFGSPMYMSPEQALRQQAPIDARTDIYSLAVTLYELLLLRLPYEGTTQVNMLAALTSGRVLLPGSIDPFFPVALEDVLMQALRREPGDRHGSAGAFAADLRAALEGVGGGPGRNGPAARALRASDPPASDWPDNRRALTPALARAPTRADSRAVAHKLAWIAAAMLVVSFLPWFVLINAKLTSDAPFAIHNPAGVTLAVNAWNGNVASVPLWLAVVAAVAAALIAWTLPAEASNGWRRWPFLLLVGGLLHVGLLASLMLLSAFRGRDAGGGGRVAPQIGTLLALIVLILGVKVSRRLVAPRKRRRRRDRLRR